MSSLCILLCLWLVPRLEILFILFILFQKRLQKELMKMVKEPPEGIIIDQGPML
jgi:hypothetical protein